MTGGRPRLSKVAPSSLKCEGRLLTFKCVNVVVLPALEELLLCSLKSWKIQFSSFLLSIPTRMLLSSLKYLSSIGRLDLMLTPLRLSRLLLHRRKLSSLSARFSNWSMSLTHVVEEAMVEYGIMTASQQQNLSWDFTPGTDRGESGGEFREWEHGGGIWVSCWNI